MDMQQTPCWVLSIHFETKLTYNYGPCCHGTSVSFEIKRLIFPTIASLKKNHYQIWRCKSTFKIIFFFFINVYL